MSSEPVKFTEVMDKRLLKATSKGRKRFILADNSYNVYVSDETSVFVSDIIGLV